MLRLKTNKTKLYKLISSYAELPPMKKVTFWKAFGVPDYWLEWTEAGGLRCNAFLCACMGTPLLAIEKKEIYGRPVSRMVHMLDLKDLQVRGMVEDVTTAADRRKRRAADKRL